MHDNTSSAISSALHVADPVLAASIDSQLTMVILDGVYLVEVMNRAAALAAAHIPGVDHAGITLAFDDRAPPTIAYTDHRVTALDDAQRSNGSGPSLLARNTDHLVSVDLSDMGRLWPDVAITSYENGIDRILAAPLHRAGQVVGTLNFYTDAVTTAIVSPSSPVLACLHGHLERILSNYHDHCTDSHRAHTVDLHPGRQATYERAVGIIAETAQCSIATAAEALEMIARRENITVESAATAIVGTRRP